MKHIEVWNVASQWHRPQEEYLNHTTLSTFFFNSSFCFPGSIFKRKHLRRFSQHCFKELPATCHRRSHAGSTALSTQSARHVGTELCQMPFLTKLNSAKQAPNEYTWGTGAKVFLVTSCACSTSCCLWYFLLKTLCNTYIGHVNPHCCTSCMSIRTSSFSMVFPCFPSVTVENDCIIVALAAPNTCYNLAKVRYKLSNLQFP